MRLLVLLSALAHLCASTPVLAQTHLGSGVSGGTLANGVTVNYVRLHWGPPDSVRLGAAILWRGTTDWTLTRAGAEAERAHAAMDSARRDAERRGVQVGGTITASANAWVEFDKRTMAITVLRGSHVLPARDSALVLLVDRVDHVGGEPVVASVTVACPTTSDTSRGHIDLPQAMIEGMRLMTEHWRGCLLSDSRIADFLKPGSSR